MANITVDDVRDVINISVEDISDEKLLKIIKRAPSRIDNRVLE